MCVCVSVSGWGGSPSPYEVGLRAGVKKLFLIHEFVSF